MVRKMVKPDTVVNPDEDSAEFQAALQRREREAAISLLYTMGASRRSSRPRGPLYRRPLQQAPSQPITVALPTARSRVLVWQQSDIVVDLPAYLANMRQASRDPALRSYFHT